MPSSITSIFQRLIRNGCIRRAVKKHGSTGDEMLPGIYGAGDGLVIQISEPTGANGESAKSYMNREGFFALLVQAFCGAFTNFWYFNVGCDQWHHGLHCILQLWTTWRRIGCPFYWMGHTAHAVGVTELHSPDISSDLLVLIVIKLRITIERAFGQLVRRFGILWCANSSRLRNVATMVLACAKLHNTCVDWWILNGRRGNVDIVS
jgi:hypothetical protein